MKSHFDIRLPRVGPRDWTFALLGTRDDQIVPDTVTVTSASQVAVQRKMLDVARFFRREFGYDFNPWDDNAREEDETVVGILWRSDGGHYPDVYVGGAIFRRHTWDSGDSAYVMQAAWFHPFVRRQGLLTKAWPHLAKRFGPFYCDVPLSDAMREFLSKWGYVRGRIPLVGADGQVIQREYRKREPEAEAAATTP